MGNGHYDPSVQYVGLSDMTASTWKGGRAFVYHCV